MTINVAPQNNAPLPDGSAFGDANRGHPSIGDPEPRGTTRTKQSTERPKQPWLWGLRLRTKILAVLLVPAIVAVALGALALSDRLQSASRFDRAEEGVEVTQKAAALANELQRERDLMTAFIAANRSRDRTAMEQEKAKVDDAVQQFRATKDKVQNQPAPVQEAYTRATDRLDSVGPLRSVVETTQFPEDAAFNSYTSIIDTMLQLQREVAASTSDSTVIRLARAAEAVGRAHEQVGQERSMVLAAILQSNLSTSQIDQIQAAGARHDAAIADFLNVAASEDNTLYSDTVAGPEVDGRERLRQIALARGLTNAPLNINLDEWDHDSGVTMDLLNQVQTKLLDKERVTAQDSGAQYRNAALLSAIPVLLALILTVVLALIVARSILRQLRVLRKTALEVADTRLPEAVQRILADPNPIQASRNAIPPVPVFTNEEIGQLARSFDVVHNQAVRLAAEQAVLRDNVNAMFVNLSRRSQTLVERQLSLIDRLEQDEQDPDQLSNLFELDHLATRMRRNSENLLVLSGSGFGKRLNRPVQVGELVGAAVSEVEQYARVEVAAPPDIAVQGWVVNDLIHLIAELLDNATAYSEPQTKVTVRLAKTRNQELAIQISDRGVGMSESDIIEANERLSNPPDIDVAVSRRMGLYVVARLAKRHSIRVRLHTSEDIDGGTRATIAVPPDLVTSGAQQPARSGIASAFGGAPMAPAEMSSPSMGSMFPPITAQAPQELSGPREPAAEQQHHTGPHGVYAGQQDQPREMRDLTELMPPLSTSGNSSGGYEHAEPIEEPAEGSWAGDHTTAEFGAAARSAGPGYGVQSYGGDEHQPAGSWSGGVDESARPYEAEQATAEPGEQRFVPKVSFVAGDGAERNAADMPPWAGTDSEDLRQLVAAWQQQGMEEQEEIHAERTGQHPAVQPNSNGQNHLANPNRAGMADFEAEDQTGSALSSMSGETAEHWQNSLGGPPPEGHRDLDAPTERLPIYEAVLSQWFQADEADADADSTKDAAPIADAPTAASAPQAVTPDTELATPDTEPAQQHESAGSREHIVSAGGEAVSGESGRTERPAFTPSPRPRTTEQQSAEFAREQAHNVPDRQQDEGRFESAGLPRATNGVEESSGLPKRTPGARTWKSPGDEGWNAAHSLLTAKNDDVTGAGLPKRVPKAHLVPGSAQPRQQPRPTNSPELGVPPRSADSTRTRMSSFQKGIRRGRHARVDALAERLSQDSPNAGDNGHDEGRL